MIYTQGGLNKIVTSAADYLNVFKKIFNQYLTDMKQEDLLYDQNEIKVWLETLISSQNAQISLNLLKKYYMDSAFRPYVSEIFNQYCRYIITAKKCFEITHENDKEKILKYCTDLLFKHINKAIELNLDLISTIDFDNFTEAQLDDYFIILETTFKNNLMSEIILNNKLLLAKKENVRPILTAVKAISTEKSSINPHSEYMISIAESAEENLTKIQSTDITLLAANFERLFQSKTPEPKSALCWTPTFDSELGEVEEHIIENTKDKAENSEISPVTVSQIFSSSRIIHS